MTSLPALRRAGGLAVAAGSLLAVAGSGAWFAVTRQLRQEQITVPPKAPALAGRRVQGPASAYVQSEVIRANAERGAGGRTFAEVTSAMMKAKKGSPEEAELRDQRATLATAVSLRASLLTSVLAYGVSALVAGLGAFLVLFGAQLRTPSR